MDQKILKTPEPPQRNEEQDNSIVVAAVAVGGLTAAVFGIAGFFLINDRTGSMGSVLFLLLPVATGFATALVVRGRKLITASLWVGALLCTVILIVTGMEGWVCVLMSAPLIAVGLTIGALLGSLFRSLVIDKLRNKHLVTLLMLAVLPFFLMGANKAEEESRRAPRFETFANTLLVDGPRERVWNQLQTFEKVQGSKGLLMRIGLPVPVSCTMSGEGVGATRTCYFETGHIEERVTEWNPPSSMKFEIVAFDVPGRPWLSFKDASYDLTQEGERTLITRKTTIISRLSPAWYWRRMEKIGVETEHEYLFEEVKRRVNGAR
jgi:hypothetical protein